MKLGNPQIISTDVLIIGSGSAGLRAAVEAKKYDTDILLVSESPLGLKNNTAVSGGGFCGPGIWKKPGDCAEEYFKDTLIAGRFLNDRDMVGTLVYGATQQYYDLMRFGCTKYEGKYEWIPIAGHSFIRTAGPEKERGFALTIPMLEIARKLGVRFMEGTLITKLLRTEDTVSGAVAMDADGQVFVLNAKSIILATGGAGNLYLRTDNAIGATGDGYALAYDLGATLRDMEFVQFYPTGFGPNGNKMMYYEEFQPRGATFRNSLNEDIIQKYGEQRLTRDMLSRMLMKEIAEGRDIEGSVICDFSKIPEDKRVGYPGLYHYEEKFPVAPTQHFCMGGIEVSWSVEVGLNGLFAAGEVCGGTQGANRLSCNAITETLVFGTIAGDRAAFRATKAKHIPAPQKEVTAEIGRLETIISGKGKEQPEQLLQSLKKLMWERVGVLRNESALKSAETEIHRLGEQLRNMAAADSKQLRHAIKLGYMLTVAEMITKAALMRTESRGSHYRTDFPKEDNEQWLKIIEIRKQNGKMTLTPTPVNVDINQFKR